MVNDQKVPRSQHSAEVPGGPFVFRPVCPRGAPLSRCLFGLPGAVFLDKRACAGCYWVILRQPNGRCFWFIPTLVTLLHHIANAPMCSWVFKDPLILIRKDVPQCPLGEGLIRCYISRPLVGTPHVPQPGRAERKNNKGAKAEAYAAPIQSRAVRGL